jgi:hypothetical protein
VPEKCPPGARIHTTAELRVVVVALLPIILPQTPEHLSSMAEVRRIALSDPLQATPPRFLVGGQPNQSVSGDVKMFEWRREVGPATDLV